MPQFKRPNSPFINTDAFIRAIQADAVKHGMTLAAELASNYDGKGTDSRGYYSQLGDAELTKRDISTAILTARNNFKP